MSDNRGPDDRNRLTLELTASLHGIPRVRREDGNTLETINVSISDTEAVIRFRVLNATLWPKVLFFLLDNTAGHGFKLNVSQQYFKHRGEIVYCWQMDIVSETGIAAAIQSFREVFLWCATAAVVDPTARSSTRPQKPVANVAVAEDLSKMEERASNMAESAPTTVRALLAATAPAAVASAAPTPTTEVARARVPSPKGEFDPNSDGIIPENSAISGRDGKIEGFRAVAPFPVDMGLFGRRNRVGKPR
jgi:hypothetical protein